MKEHKRAILTGGPWSICRSAYSESMATDSRTLPDLKNNPNKTNWVEKAGGLPSFVKRIAKHLVAEQGYTESRAIATAVSQCKKVCATGRTFGGKTSVSPAARARYCKAAAEWEAKEAKTKLKEDTDVKKPDTAKLAVSTAATLIELAADIGPIHTGALIESDTEMAYSFELHEELLDALALYEGVHGFDPSGALLEMDRDVSVVGGKVTFDPEVYPEIASDRMASILAISPEVYLKDGTKVLRVNELGKPAVIHKGRRYSAYGHHDAASKALSMSAKATDANSVGGTKSYDGWYSLRRNLVSSPLHEDFRGTFNEILHPRGPDGRWTKKLIAMDEASPGDKVAMNPHVIATKGLAQRWVVNSRSGRYVGYVENNHQLIELTKTLEKQHARRVAQRGGLPAPRKQGLPPKPLKHKPLSKAESRRARWADGFQSDYARRAALAEGFAHVPGKGFNVNFKEDLHPRDFRGKFAKKLGGLNAGEKALLPDGGKITRNPDGADAKFSFRGSGSSYNSDDAEKTVGVALDASARSTHPKSVGGEKSYSTHDDAKAGKERKEVKYNPKGKSKKGPSGMPMDKTPGEMTDGELKKARKAVAGAVKADEPKSETYVKYTADGKTRRGTLVGQRPNALRVKDDDGVESWIPRTRVKETGPKKNGQGNNALPDKVTATAKKLDAMKANDFYPKMMDTGVYVESHHVAGGGQMFTVWKNGMPYAPNLSNASVAASEYEAAKAGAGPGKKKLKESFDESLHPRSGGRFIAKGANGSDVKHVQRAFGVHADGKFGSKTQSAVRRFQRKNGLKVDGVIGRQTAAAIAGDKDASKVKVGSLSASDLRKIRTARRRSRK